MALPELLCDCVDVYELAVDATVEAMCWIDAQLEPLGVQLDSSSSDALHLALEKVLGELKVEYPTFNYGERAKRLEEQPHREHK